jgi:hypothetical protein
MISYTFFKKKKNLISYTFEYASIYPSISNIIESPNQNN